MTKMRRIVALSILSVAIVAILALAPTYLKRGTVSAEGTFKLEVSDTFTVTNGRVPLQDVVSTYTQELLRGPARLNEVNDDAELLILNRTDARPTPQTVQYLVKFKDSKTGATLATQSGSIPPGGQFNVASVRSVLSSAGAFGATNVFAVSAEVGTNPDSGFTKTELTRKQFQTGPLIVPDRDVIFVVGTVGVTKLEIPR